MCSSFYSLEADSYISAISVPSSPHEASGTFSRNQSSEMKSERRSRQNLGLINKKSIWGQSGWKNWHFLEKYNGCFDHPGWYMRLLYESKNSHPYIGRSTKYFPLKRDKHQHSRIGKTADGLAKVRRTLKIFLIVASSLSRSSNITFISIFETSACSLILKKKLFLI